MTPDFDRQKAEITIAKVTTRDDFDYLHALIVEYEADLPESLRHGSSPTLSDVEEAYANPNGAFLALVDGMPAGCVAYRKVFDDATPVMMRLFVQPAYRGCGIARLLVVTLIDHLFKAGYSRVVLDTDKTQLAAAHALYLSLGFIECEPYGPVDYRCPTFMALELR